MMRLKDLVGEIKDRIDLTDLAEELGVRRRYGSWLCPFHEDSNPSLCIKRRGYRCYACGAQGDALKLVMGLRGLTFRESLDYLADRTGIRIPGVRRSRSSRRPPVLHQPVSETRTGPGERPVTPLDTG